MKFRLIFKEKGRKSLQQELCGKILHASVCNGELQGDWGSNLRAETENILLMELQCTTEETHALFDEDGRKQQII